MNLLKWAYTAHLVICTPTCTSERDNYSTSPKTHPPSASWRPSFCTRDARTLPGHPRHHPQLSPCWGTEGGRSGIREMAANSQCYLSHAELVFKPSCDSLLVDPHKHGEAWGGGGIMKTSNNPVKCKAEEIRHFLPHQ